MKSPKLLTRYLKQTGLLRPILDHSDEMLLLLELVRSGLPHDLAMQCRMVHVKDNTLVIYVESAAWAARFRYITPKILGDLKKNPKFQFVSDVKLKVFLLPQTQQHSSKIHHKNVNISEKNLDLIRQTASSKPSKLRHSLLRLAKTLEKMNK